MERRGAGGLKVVIFTATIVIILFAIFSLFSIFLSSGEEVTMNSLMEESVQEGNPPSGPTFLEDDLVEEPVNLPEITETPLNIIFGLENGMNLSAFVFTILIWIVLLVLLTDIMMINSPYSNFTSVTVGIAFTIILVNLGIINWMVYHLGNFGNVLSQYISTIESDSPGSRAISVITTAIIILVALHIGRMMGRWSRRKREIEQAGEEGTETAAQLSWIGKLRDGLAGVSLGSPVRSARTFFGRRRLNKSGLPASLPTVKPSKKPPKPIKLSLPKKRKLGL